MAPERLTYDAEGMRHVAGSSLIESLVALAVFAIGYACHGTWIMQSMATHARASRLMAATTIVASLEAHMRSNRAADLRSFRAALARHVGPASSFKVSCEEAAACTISVAWRDRPIIDWTFHP